MSSTGALALGIGLGAALSTYIGRVALPILVAGVAGHGWGMLQKRRLEASEDYTPTAWEAALYWVCWFTLAALLLLIVIRAITG